MEAEEGGGSREGKEDIEGIFNVHVQAQRSVQHRSESLRAGPARWQWSDIEGREEEGGAAVHRYLG